MSPPRFEGFTGARDTLLELRLVELLERKRALRRQKRAIKKAWIAHQEDMHRYLKSGGLLRPDLAEEANRIHHGLLEADRRVDADIQRHATLLAAPFDDPVTVLAGTSTLLIEQSRAMKRIRERKSLHPGHGRQS